MGFNKRHVTTHGIFAAYHNGGFQSVSKYFSVDAIIGINKNGFTGDIYNLFLGYMNSKIKSEEIIEKIEFELKRHESLIRQSKELSKEYINQPDTAQQSWARESIEKIDKELGYYV